MVKMAIWTEEQWPVFEMEAPQKDIAEREFDVPRDIVERYRRCKAEWSFLQGFLRGTMEGQPKEMETK